eukprot:TRINITY_DN26537_c0_g1_i1.p1 TRINITY_DN26537_c0_g1~~TRINITY_DN26537_c0_g1_i1.p1  ORF type:complete len:789 (-),score=150.48 TRINITY_DN26537_c0_g1_i1:420-2786(-)
MLVGNVFGQGQGVKKNYLQDALNTIRVSQRNRKVVQVAAQQKLNMREMSSQMREMRAQMEQDEQLSVLMAGLRGSNIVDNNFAADDVTMRLVEVEDDPESALPLTYDPLTISDYWGRRPVSVVKRILQLLGISGGFLSKIGMDLVTKQFQENEVRRAIELREIVTSLGPAYIKLGQALSIRPDILSPAAMVELQKLCDKVPSFDNVVAMNVIQEQLGKPWYEVFAELSEDPIAAASLGQVYKGKLKTGEIVAVKVQRPYVLETVTVDLFIIRKIGMYMRKFPQISVDVVGLLDEWAARFFDELDYVKEGKNGIKFAEQMAADLPQVVVPETFLDYTSRKVLTTGWLDGEKLSQSTADDVGSLVNVGVVCYLKQLLDTGFFHADPHPGNLIRTPDGRLAVLDFGLMTQVDNNIKFGMIEAVSHLIHRDYDAIVRDFVTLDFIPENTDLKPILPVLAKVFDQALEGGGAKNINFQELAADLAQITFDYPFRIPPYFALIIRAIGVLEGIALVGNPEFALVDEAYPYLAKRLLTDDTPRLRAALKYMVYGKNKVFDAERLIDLLSAFESFKVASTSARGEMDSLAVQQSSNSNNQQNNSQIPNILNFPDLFNTRQGPILSPIPAFSAMAQSTSPFDSPLMQSAIQNSDSSGAREALKFMFSQEGMFFREFIMDELVRSIDALSRDQLQQLCINLGLSGIEIPILLPGVKVQSLPLAPQVSEEDRLVVENVTKLILFLVGGDVRALAGNVDARFAQDLIPVVPSVVNEVLPELSRRLFSRISARFIRDLYVA